MLEQGIKVIDLSADFRVKDPEVYRYFYKHEHPAPALLQKSVYGLPEAYRDQIRGARLVACPGCYPTSILVPLLPVIRAKMIRLSSIIVNSLSGVSGAGRKADTDLLFVECNESARPYGLPSHRHLSEVEQELSNAAGEPVVIQFAPAFDPAQSRDHHDDSCGSGDRAELSNLSKKCTKPPTAPNGSFGCWDRVDTPISKTSLAQIVWKLPGGLIREPGESF